MQLLRLEVNCNHGCNARCEHCNRAIGLIDLGKKYDLTGEQMRRAVQQLHSLGYGVKRLTLAGGEPILNLELQEIMDEASKVAWLRKGRLLTNDIPQAKARREALTLPKPFRWVRAPLITPDDPMSGKTKHTPYFVSPADLGITSTFEQCSVRTFCGTGFDSRGWSMCGVDPTLGRLLRINPYQHDKPKLTATPEICKHCMYGTSRRTQRKIHKQVQAGKIPAISDTYREGIKRFREDPIDFPVY